MSVAQNNIVSRKVMGMDIHHLREWAEFMDKAMVVSLVIAAIAAAAVGVTTWLSIKFNGAVRTQENTAFESFKLAADSRAVELERETAKANERAASLERDAEQARERSAQLEKGVAEANARAAEAQRDLERFKAPRWINDAQLAALVARLNQFQGVAADVWLLHGSSADAAPLAARLSSALSASGWRVGMSNLMGGPSATGIVVAIRRTPSAADQAAAVALVDELNSIGLTTSLQTGVTNDPVTTLGAFVGSSHSGSPSDLWVLVGSKP